MSHEVLGLRRSCPRRRPHRLPEAGVPGGLDDVLGPVQYDMRMLINNLRGKEATPPPPKPFRMSLIEVILLVLLFWMFFFAFFPNLFWSTK